MDSQLDYPASAETLKQKMIRAGQDVPEWRTWLETQPEAGRQGEKVELPERVGNEQFEAGAGQRVVRQTEIPATPLPIP